MTDKTILLQGAEDVINGSRQLYEAAHFLYKELLEMGWSYSDEDMKKIHVNWFAKKFNVMPTTVSTLIKLGEMLHDMPDHYQAVRSRKIEPIPYSSIDFIYQYHSSEKITQLSKDICWSIVSINRYQREIEIADEHDRYTLDRMMQQYKNDF